MSPARPRACTRVHTPNHVGCMQRAGTAPTAPLMASTSNTGADMTESTDSRASRAPLTFDDGELCLLVMGIASFQRERPDSAARNHATLSDMRRRLLEQVNA